MKPIIPGLHRGGARSGAGRPRGSASRPKLMLIGCPPDVPPLDFLLAVMRNELVDMHLRIAAAKAALPFVAKRGEGEKPAVAADDIEPWSVLLGGRK
jgi:hypothetical protein